MSDSVPLRQHGGRPLVYLMKPSCRGKNKSSKIQFSRQPTAAFAVAIHIIDTHRGERDLKGMGPPTAAGAGARTSKSRHAEGSGAVQLRSSPDFACKTLIALAAVVPLTTYILKAFSLSSQGGGVLK